jgi:phage-related protein
MASEAALDLIARLKDEASPALKQLAGIIKELAPGALALGSLAGLTLAMGKLIMAAGEEEAAMVRLGISVNNTGAAFEPLRSQTEGIMGAMRGLGTDCEDTLGALSSLTQITGDYQKAMALLPVVADMAAAKQMDLGTAAALVGRAAMGSVDTLKRYGIVLKEGATAAEALTAMQQKFGGAAAAMAATLPGQLAVLKTQWGELGEVVGSALVPLATKVVGGLANMVTAAQPIVAGFIENIKGGFGSLAEAAQGPLEAARGVFTSVLNAIGSVVANAMGQIRSWWIANHQAIAEITGAALNTVIALWNRFGPPLVAFISGMWNAISTIFSASFTVVLGIASAALQLLQGNWRGALQTLITTAQEVWGKIRGVVATALDIVLDIMARGLEILADGWASFSNWLNDSIFGKIYDGFMTFAGNLMGGIGKIIQALGLQNTAVGQSVLSVMGWFETEKGKVVDTTKTWVNSMKDRVTGLHTWASETRTAVDHAMTYWGAYEAYWRKWKEAQAGGAAPPEKPVLPNLEDLVPGIGDFGWGGAADVTEKAKETAESVTKTVAELIKGILEDTQKINEILAARMPDIVTPVRLWLDRLLAVTEEARAWSTANEAPLKAAWVGLAEIFKAWSEAISPLSSTLSTIKTIMETLATKMIPVRTSVTRWLDLGLDLVREARAWLAENKVTAQSIWPEFTVIFKAWGEALSSLNTVIGGVKSIADALAVKAPAAQVSLYDLLETMTRMVREAYEWMSTSEEYGALNLGVWLEDIGEYLQQWVVALGPLGAVLDAVRGIAEALGSELPRGVVSIQNLLERMRAFFYAAYQWAVETKEWGAGRLDDMTTELAAFLTSWSVALGPLGTALGNVRTIADALGTKLPEAKVSILTMLQLVSAFLWELVSALPSGIGLRTTIDSALAIIGDATEPGTIAYMFAALTTALAPIVNVLGSVKTIAETLANKMPEAKTTVAAMFANVGKWLNEAIVAVTSTDLSGYIADLTEEVQTKLNTVAAGIKSVLEILTGGSSVLALLGENQKPLDIYKLESLLAAVKIAIQRAINAFADMDIDTTKIETVKTAMDALNAITTAFDKFADTLGGLNIPDVGEGSTFYKFITRLRDEFIPALNTLPAIPESTKTSFANLEATLQAAVNVINYVNKIAWAGSVEWDVQKATQNVASLITNLSAMFTTQAAPLAALKVQAEAFGVGMVAVFNNIWSFWTAAGETKPVNSLLNEFIVALTGAIEGLKLQLGDMLAFLGEKGMMKSLGEINWEPQGTTIGVSFQSALLAAVQGGLETVKGWLDPGAPLGYAQQIGAYSWFGVGQSIGQSLVSGIQAGASAGRVTINVDVNYSGSMPSGREGG